MHCILIHFGRISLPTSAFKETNIHFCDRFIIIQTYRGLDGGSRRPQNDKMSKSWHILKGVVVQTVMMMAVFHHGGVVAFLTVGQIKSKSHFLSSSPSCFTKAVWERIRPIAASDITVIGETLPQNTVSCGDLICAMHRVYFKRKEFISFHYRGQT